MARFVKFFRLAHGDDGVVVNVHRVTSVTPDGDQCVLWLDDGTPVGDNEDVFGTLDEVLAILNGEPAPHEERGPR